MLERGLELRVLDLLREREQLGERRRVRCLAARDVDALQRVCDLGVGVCERLEVGPDALRRLAGELLEDLDLLLDVAAGALERLRERRAEVGELLAVRGERLGPEADVVVPELVVVSAAVVVVLVASVTVVVVVDVVLFFFPQPAAARTRTSTSRMLRIWVDLRRMTAPS